MRILTFLAALALAVTGCAPDSPPPAANQGPLLYALLGGGQLTFPAAGPVVVSFVDPSAPSSRSQIVVLRSMATQYTAAGLTVVVADATGNATNDSLTNYAHDWNLGSAKVRVAAPAATPALKAAYHVTTAPDTLLLTADGTVVQRWQGNIAAAQDLALPIQGLLSSASPVSS